MLTRDWRCTKWNRWLFVYALKAIAGSLLSELLRPSRRDWSNGKQMECKSQWEVVKRGRVLKRRNNLPQGEPAKQSTWGTHAEHLCENSALYVAMIQLEKEECFLATLAELCLTCISRCYGILPPPQKKNIYIHIHMDYTPHSESWTCRVGFHIQ